MGGDVHEAAVRPFSRSTCAVAACPRKTSLSGSTPATARTSSSICGAAGSGMPSTSDPPDGRACLVEQR